MYVVRVVGGPSTQSYVIGVISCYGNLAIAP